MTASTTAPSRFGIQVRVRPLVDDPELGQRVGDEDRQGTGYLDRFAHTPVMPKRIGLVLTLVLVLAGCGGDSKPEARGPLRLRPRRLARVPGQRAREPQLSDRDPRRLLRQPGRRRPSDRLLGQASGQGPVPGSDPRARGGRGSPAARRAGDLAGRARRGGARRRLAIRPQPGAAVPGGPARASGRA